MSIQARQSPVIAQRELVVFEEGHWTPAWVRLHAPVEVEEHWECGYEFVGFGPNQGFAAKGEDSYEALQAAMAAISEHASMARQHKEGRLHDKRGETFDVLKELGFKRPKD